MIEFNVKSLPSWLLSIFFYKIDFKEKGVYTREMFIDYNSYKNDYYYKLDNDWRIHNLSNYGIITVWYFKAN